MLKRPHRLSWTRACVGRGQKRFVSFHAIFSRYRDRAGGGGLQPTTEQLCQWGFCLSRGKTRKDFLYERRTHSRRRKSHRNVKFAKFLMHFQPFMGSPRRIALRYAVSFCVELCRARRCTALCDAVSYFVASVMPCALRCAMRYRFALLVEPCAPHCVALCRLELRCVELCRARRTALRWPYRFALLVVPCELRCLCRLVLRCVELCRARRTALSRAVRAAAVLCSP